MTLRLQAPVVPFDHDVVDRARQAVAAVPDDAVDQALQDLYDTTVRVAEVNRAMRHSRGGNANGSARCGGCNAWVTNAGAIHSCGWDNGAQRWVPGAARCAAA